MLDYVASDCNKHGPLCSPLCCDMLRMLDKAIMLAFYKFFSAILYRQIRITFKATNKRKTLQNFKNMNLKANVQSVTI